MTQALTPSPLSIVTRLVASTLLAASIGAVVAAPTLVSASVTKGTLFYNGGTVGTVVVPAPLPNGGVDPFYKVTNGASGQLGIAGVAPGSTDYHGGAWAVSTVTFQPSVTPYLLTSAQAVAAAATRGDVVVTRVPALDFLCPVQP